MSTSVSGRRAPVDHGDAKNLNSWTESALGRILTEFNASLERYPLMPLGTPDPSSRLRDRSRIAP